ncbi:hypothetical protein Taro_054312 [Colocasia esculenta]|uniref:BHLH domain-containing protein n=1 Tax=Colocasia esculenta TaxID=4460 RepID=A0A843XND2_COLES|nr:hypothetical protein [Colocasia esculenta]
MYGSPASSRDLNLSFQAGPLKQGKEEADLNLQHQQQQQQMSTGLLRFRSAPSSLLGEVSEEFLPHRSSSPEGDAMFARFVPPDPRDQIGEKPQAAAPQRSPQLMAAMEHDRAEAVHPQSGGFTHSASQMVYHPLQRQQLPSHRSGVAAAALQGESPYRAATSVAMDNEQVDSPANSSGLVRHSSSPAGLFSHLGVDNGYAMMRGMFRPGAGSAGEAALEGSRLKSQLSFSSRQSSSSGMMSPISEIECERIGGNGPEDGGRCFIPGLPLGSWEDPSLLSDSFTGSSRRPTRDSSEAQVTLPRTHLTGCSQILLRLLDQMLVLFDNSQNGDVRVHLSSLGHHFSLPKASSEMASILQFQDAVPCKIRAKRGCATHPRSIAERVRRTRISERMRKLQELVPNMDKQTSTADMLDLAVDYIKDLQRQVKNLSDSRATCTCSSKHKQ